LAAEALAARARQVDDDSLRQLADRPAEQAGLSKDQQVMTDRL
jgi:hypothetical protein